MLFTKKYEPKTEKEIVSQDLAVKKIKNFIINFKENKGRALLLYGNVGIGKTSSVYAIANDLDLEVFELNASDQRNKDQIETLVKNASSQLSLFKKGKIILIEEIDGISGIQDRGAITSLINLIQTSYFPIIFTCNDIELEKIQPLLKKTDLVKFYPLDQDAMIKALEKICKQEKIKYKNEDLIILTKNQDLRAAITDLQSSIINNELKISDISRDIKEDIQIVLRNVFKQSNAKLSYDSIDSLNEDLIDYGQSRSPVIFGDDSAYVYWIEENIPKEYSGADLIKAFDQMSRSDVFRGRILRRQHWRFLVYLRALTSSGISLAKTKTNNALIEYKKTRRSPKQNKKLWFLVDKRKRVISEKIAEKTHRSIHNVKSELPYYKFISRKFSLNEFDLSPEELDYLNQKV